MNDYQALGNEHVWAIDAWKRLGYVASTRGFLQPADGAPHQEPPVAVVLAEIFAELDG